jgi:spermidine/putrescine-binding protein
VEVDRRKFIKSSLALGLKLMVGPGLVVTACSPKGKAGKLETIRVYGPEVVSLDDWSDFTEKTGMGVEWTGMVSDPALFVQEVIVNKVGEKFDLLVFDGGVEDRLGPEGAILSIDEDAMENWAGVSDDVKRSPLLQGPDGTQYGVPLVFNADSFGYYPDVIGDPEPLSYSLLFNDERTLGQVSVEDSWLSTFPMAAMYLSYNGMADITDPANMTPEEAKATADFLIERKKAGQFRALWSSWEESVDLLGNREVVVSNVWEPVIKELERQGKVVKYARAIEGYNKWMVGGWLPAELEERGTLSDVYLALNYFLGGYYGMRIAALRGYATGRPDLALQYAKDNDAPQEEVAAVENNVVKIEEKFGAKMFWQNSNPDHLAEIQEEWERFRQA